MIKTDVVIIGAGPCGLFQVFELGLLGLNAEVIDSISQPGGQCTELYADKPIYDIPGIPVCSAEELTLALLKQIEPFNYGMHLGEEVTIVRKNDDASFYVETSAGKKFQAKAVVIAGGVGSFQPRQLKVPGADEFSGKTLHYRVRDSQQFTNKKLAIFGGLCFTIPYVLFGVFLGPEFPSLLGGLIGLFLMITAVRKGLFLPEGEPWEFPPEKDWEADWKGVIRSDVGEERSHMTLVRAWFPYVLVAVLLVLTRLPSLPLKELLTSVQFGWTNILGTPLSQGFQPLYVPVSTQCNF